MSGLSVCMYILYVGSVCAASAHLGSVFPGYVRRKSVRAGSVCVASLCV